MENVTGCKPTLSFRIKKFFGVYDRRQKRWARNKHNEMMKIFDSAHFIQLKIRINGEWREYEGDYIKYL